MAKNNELPDFHQKRKILFGSKTTPQRMREVGKQFMEAERYDDALEFFARTDAEELVREIAGTALQGGDTPLYMRAKRILEEEISQQEWETLAENALQAGSPAKAYVAKVKAGKEEEAQKLRTRMEQTGEEQSGPPAEDQPERDKTAQA